MFKIIKNYVAILLIFFFIDLFANKIQSMFNIFGAIPTIYSLFNAYWFTILIIFYFINKYAYDREIDKNNNFDYYLGNINKIRITLIIFNIFIGLMYTILFNNITYSIAYIITSILFIFIIKSKKERFKIISDKEIKKYNEEQKTKTL